MLKLVRQLSFYTDSASFTTDTLPISLIYKSILKVVSYYIVDRDSAIDIVPLSFIWLLVRTHSKKVSF